jgi:microcin C transport system substrate-binding protein
MTGEPLTIEFLESDNQFDRILNPYIQNLKRLGIGASIRLVDPELEVKLHQNFTFDSIVYPFGESESPGNEQRDYWGSAAADKPGSHNYAGIKDPAVDKLIDHVIFAKTRDELIAATKALDRVLLWNRYVVPTWYRPDTWIAYWDKFQRPKPGPGFDVGFPSIWWYDKDAAAKAETLKHQ